MKRLEQCTLELITDITMSRGCNGRHNYRPKTETRSRAMNIVRKNK